MKRFLMIEALGFLASMLFFMTLAVLWIATP